MSGQKNSVDNVLYLRLSGNSGTIELVRSLPVQRLTLKHVGITWDSTGDSTTNGSLINIELEPFSNLRFNSNRTRHINALPLFNDVSQRVSQYNPDVSVHADSLVKQSFEYKIYDVNGGNVANLTNVDLIFSYTEKAII